MKEKDLEQIDAVDRNKRRILRSRIIEFIEYQFKNGLELSDIGVILHPPAMINLIENYNEDGEPVTREPARLA